MGVRLENGKYYIDEDYIIKRQRHIIGAPSHTHDFIELEYFRKGHCTHIIDGCSYTVKIPMSHGVDSLNVAAASAVAFWQLRAR